MANEVDPRIVGTYWLVANCNGERYIVRGKKPVPVEGRNTWISPNPEIGWIPLDGESSIKYAPSAEGPIPVRLYKKLNFPKISYDDDPIEIEIGQTGRVYTYET